ncbi:hypothetical protein Ade02nite_95230 [Paractinoplanes deccanensis]|uniref:RHS repeat-associated core domain-containing protein n=1 Tax=Paractinoplanes deccanensis TaxID=113561 RepID=A0ABQ3YLK7_9ACTN|nr:RHS repeat-associated core domain-containing protein [Actinoplanes deccanensis]GID80882.1 hypothetical protein Ade02nite_95230 [Actinoplanes deccanensis]
MPSADTSNAGGNTTVAYHSTDFVKSITQNGRTTNYTLDVNGGRVRSWTDSNDAATRLNHYSGDGDSPTWTQENTSRYTRTLGSTSSLAAIYDSSTGTPTFQITNLHGDLVAAMENATPGLASTSIADEYGNPTSASATGKRYGWLGNPQRASDNPPGLLLMGARLYNPSTGRFLQVDPIYGGSCNSYEYTCADPINAFDLTGTTRVRERNTQTCTKYLCISIRRICDVDRRCSMNWNMSFRKDFRQAYIHAGWKWTIFISGIKVFAASYSHAEMGTYFFHGSWTTNNTSKGRGYFKCLAWSCRFDPDDTLVFSATGTATVPKLGLVGWTGGSTQKPGGGWSPWSNYG